MHYELPAHSIVLATQSEFFDTALRSKFAGGDAKELSFVSLKEVCMPIESLRVHVYGRVFGEHYGVDRSARYGAHPARRARLTAMHMTTS